MVARRTGGGQLFGEITIATELNANRTEMHRLLDQLVEDDVIPDLRDPGQPFHIISERDIDKIRRAWTSRVLPQSQPANDRHNNHRYFEEERIAQMFSIEGGHMHTILENLVKGGKIRYLRPDPSKKSFSVQEEDMGIVQEAALEHRRQVEQMKQSQGVQQNMIQTKNPPTEKVDSPPVPEDPWAHPKGRLVTQRELLEAFTWQYGGLKSSVYRKDLPDRRREDDWDFWFLASDILYYLDHHTLRKPHPQKFVDLRKRCEDSLRGNPSVLTATFPPLQREAAPKEEKQTEPPTPPVAVTPAQPVDSPVPATEQPVVQAIQSVDTAAEALLKIDPRARAGAMATSQMMQYLYQEVGVLDVPEMRKSSVKVSITLEFDNKELLIPLNLADFGIDIQQLAPILMWTVSAPTVEHPDEAALFQIVLVNGKFHYINLESATEPEATPDPEDDPKTESNP